jgi:hypothetical protein
VEAIPLNEEIKQWCEENLSTLQYRRFTKEDLDKLAKKCNSDGCTGVSNIHVDACIVHDFLYTYHVDFYGNPITQEYADKVLREIIQQKSVFGVFSPMSWWRWIGVRIAGKSHWDT